LELMTSDEAREKFGKSFGSAAAFVQISEEQESVPIQHAYEVLKTQATKSRSLRLAKLAAQVQQTKSGHFDSVIEAIDDVIQTLKDEEADDIKKRDECKDKYQEIQSTVNDLDWKIEKNEAKISKMEEMIAAKTTEREETIEKIQQTQEEITDMEDTRKEENDEFKEAKKDDEDAIELITGARDALAKFYKENALLQAPEFKMSSKGKRKNEASGIVGLMDILIEDLETEIKNGKKDEEEGQLEFEKNVKAAKTLIKELTKKQTNLKEQIAEHEEDKTSEGEDKDANNEDLTEEQNYKAEIKPDCDFIVENFDERDKKREAEMNGLTEAKSYLAGAKPEFLQRVKPHTLRGSQ